MNLPFQALNAQPFLSEGLQAPLLVKHFGAAQPKNEPSERRQGWNVPCLFLVPCLHLHFLKSPKLCVSVVSNLPISLCSFAARRCFIPFLPRAFAHGFVV